MSGYFKIVMSLFLVRYQIDKSKRKSNILLVEVNGDACVDPHNKKGDAGQDKQLWRRKVTFGFAQLQLQHIPMKNKLMVHLFSGDPSARTLSNTLLEQPPPLSCRFQQEPLSRPRSLPQPFSEPDLWCVNT